MSAPAGFELSMSAPPSAGQMHTGNAGTEAAWFHALREVENLPVVARFTIDGEPVSKSRARFTGYGSKVRTYTPEKTRAGEVAVARAFRAAVPPGRQPDASHTYGVVALFFNGTRQRRDVDNMLKLVLDGLNKVAWADDDQVVEVTARKSYGNAGAPRTEVLVYIVGNVTRDTKECPTCGKSFPVYKSTVKTQTYCSRACHHAALAKARIRTCEHCQREYDGQKESRNRRWCSEECRVAAGRVEVDCSACGKRFEKQRCHVRPTNYCSAACREGEVRNARRRSKRAGDCPSVAARSAGPASRSARRAARRARACRAHLGRPCDLQPHRHLVSSLWRPGPPLPRGPVMPQARTRRARRRSHACVPGLHGKDSAGHVR